MPTKNPLVPIQVDVDVPTNPSEGKPIPISSGKTTLKVSSAQALPPKVNREQIRKESGQVVASRQSAKAPERSGQSRSRVATKRKGD